MIWYEDIVRDRLGVIRELSAFTGFELPEQKVEELGDMLREGLNEQNFSLILIQLSTQLFPRHTTFLRKCSDSKCNEEGRHLKKSALTGLLKQSGQFPSAQC